MVLLYNDELSDPKLPASSQNSSSSSRYSLRRRTIPRDVQKVEAPRNKMNKIHKKRKFQIPDPADVVRDVVADSSTVGKSAYTMLTETLRTFNKLYLQYIQEEEKRCARQEADKKRSQKKEAHKKGSAKRVSQSKTENIADDYSKKPAKRPDLKAISEMMRIRATLNTQKQVGPIPGIDVGHQFFSRAEMVVAGFHQHWLNGIDYIGRTGEAARKSGEDLGLSGDNFPITVSIVLSGQYEDDFDNCEEIVYTGQGGNNLLGDKRQISDQELKRGNLGLKNCMHNNLPVRVVRGHKCANSYVGKVYTYDGLYMVNNYWAEKGVSGFTVYKFRLKRLEGQPPLTTNQVYFTRGRIPESLSEIRGLVCHDITGGLEDIPIRVTNLVDEPPISPLDFVYIKDMKFSKNISFPTIASIGCNCQGICKDPRSCACAKLNGGDFPYVHRDGGRLIEPKAVLFECGPNCGCGSRCVNKTSQNGLKFRLEVFRTPKKGWGVRCWDYIPSGSAVCEYIGVVKRTDDLDPASDNSYVIDIDCLQTMKGLNGRESRLRDVCLPWYLKKLGEEASESVPFCIDAGKTGNVARFINHSCQPNLFIQCVLSSHHDIKLARLMLIAADNIPPLKELSYDYGYEIDSVMGPDGKIRQMPCFCGAQDCRKRLY